MRVLITAGPTREYIDPIRFISNNSSGLLGFYLAREAKKDAQDVWLVRGPSQVKINIGGIKEIQVETTYEMFCHVRRLFRRCDIFISAAAVCDYKPKLRLKEKRKKKSLKIELLPTVDILREMSKLRRGGQLLVGFSLETEDIIKSALRKMREKGIDLIFANPVQNLGSRYGEGVLIKSDNSMVEIGRCWKWLLAKRLWREIKNYYERGNFKFN